MKKVLMGLLITLVSTMAVSPVASAAVRVRGYTNHRTYTYVAPHYRSNPDSSKYNNYSTQGNVNPYTGKKGYTSPYKSSRRHY